MLKLLIRKNILGISTENSIYECILRIGRHYAAKSSQNTSLTLNDEVKRAPEYIYTYLRRFLHVSTSTRPKYRFAFYWQLVNKTLAFVF